MGHNASAPRSGFDEAASERIARLPYKLQYTFQGPDEPQRIYKRLSCNHDWHRGGNPPFVILPEKPNSTSICFGQRKEFKPRQVHRLEKGLKKVFADIGGGPPTLISRPHNETLKVDPKIWSSDDHQGQAIHA
ncbi:hypothetical protein CI109_100190 [Kwoniella shandongensis]|uniref:Uncharacterized protein n=1 Tax=Kwoniella shandongensis TaxID=1734106 RepID=A0AAJ8LC33_9TREE